MSDEEVWRARAACRGLGPGLFFDDDPRAEVEAKAVCVRCPVVAPCAEEGRDEPAGTWGGRTERERQQTGPAARKRGPAPALDMDQLYDVLVASDPDLPALPQVLAAAPVSSPTAYRYLERARRLGLVEDRRGRIYPIRR